MGARFFTEWLLARKEITASYLPGSSEKVIGLNLLEHKSAGQEGSGFYRQCVLLLCYIYHTLSKANTEKGEILKRQTSFGPSANSHSGSKDGSQAEPKSRVEVDLKVCGIQAVKSTVIKPCVPSSPVWLSYNTVLQGALQAYNSTNCVWVTELWGLPIIKLVRVTTTKEIKQLYPFFSNDPLLKNTFILGISKSAQPTCAIRL